MAGERFNGYSGGSNDSGAATGWESLSSDGFDGGASGWENMDARGGFTSSSEKVTSYDGGNTGASEQVANSGETIDDGEYLLTERFLDPKYQDRGFFNRWLKMSSKERKNQDFLYGLYDKWDKRGAEMPLKLGLSFEKLLDDKSYWFGVHRSDNIDGSAFENDKVLQKIMKEGLNNFGDATSGGFYESPSVEKTVSATEDMFHLTMYLKGSYKGSTGGIIVAIPREYLEDDGHAKPGMEDKVYNKNEDGYSVIKPEYLLGFVQSLGKGTVMKFKTRDEILEQKGE